MDQLNLVSSEILEEGPWDAPEAPSSAGPADAARIAERFRLGMRRLAAGVSVVTVRRDGRLFGLTATSVTSLSLNPPSVLVSIRAGSSALGPLRDSRRFTVHVLSEEQAQVADLFAGRLGTAARGSVVAPGDDADGPVRLPGVACRVDCRLARLVPVFSHVLVIGVVTDIVLGSADRPLLYVDGAYHALGRRLNQQ